MGKIKKLVKSIVYTLITTLVLGIIAYFVVGFLTNISIEANYFNYLDTNLDMNVSLVKVIVNYGGLIDLSDINFFFLEAMDDTSILDITRPNITSNSLTKGCHISHPEKGVSTNFLDIYCERINMMGSFEVNWKTLTEPLNSSLIVKYQSNINIIPYFKSIGIEKNKAPNMCKDGLCVADESSTCCSDCGCPEGHVCWEEKCTLPELSVKSFTLNNSNFYVGEKVTVKFEIEGNDDLNYSFVIYQKHELDEVYNTVYSNSSSYHQYSWWNAWFFPDRVGKWESKLIFNYDDKRIEKSTYFDVVER